MYFASCLATNFIILGSAAYIDGVLTYCGGHNIKNPSHSALKSCYSLKYSAPRWEETFPLLKVRIVLLGNISLSFCLALDW